MPALHTRPEKVAEHLMHTQRQIPIHLIAHIQRRLITAIPKIHPRQAPHQTRPALRVPLGPLTRQAHPILRDRAKAGERPAVCLIAPDGTKGPLFPREPAKVGHPVPEKVGDNPLRRQNLPDTAPERVHLPVKAGALHKLKVTDKRRAIPIRNLFLRATEPLGGKAAA